MSMYGKYAGYEGPLEVKDWPKTQTTGVSLTVQSDRDSADINNIVKRFLKSGQLPPTLRGEPFYGDVSEFGDLAESLEKIQVANALFMSYPAQVRERFDNDPAKLVEFLGDDNNRKEAEELGLVVKRPDPVVSPVVPPPGAPVQ